MELQVPSKEELLKMSPSELRGFCQKVRDFLIETTSKKGGHLASNLGSVELTLAMFLAFDFPKDQVVFDVGHQSYTYKILTGRANEFDTLRDFNGLSGFPKRGESPYDSFNTGHASNSISVGLGMAFARDLQKKKNTIISVIGDGAMTGGEAYEALNNASQLHSNFIIILNDNEMSISQNVGGVSGYFSSLRAGERYNNIKMDVKNRLNNIPRIGSKLVSGISNTKGSLKDILVPSGMLFENMGITYLGPFDGHRISNMVKIFKQAKKLNRPVLIHVKTKKGKGYSPAENHPDTFHGIDPFDIKTGKSLTGSQETYSQVFGNFMVEETAEYPEICAITAAMSKNVGLDSFRKKYPKRFFDVGIAEGHAVTFAGGLAANGMHPYVALFSSFLQRAYDQIIEDVSLMSLPVTFLVDRAGIVGRDGETHQGIFDLSYLSCIPNMSIMTPSSKEELQEALKFSLTYNQPLAIRYPRGKAKSEGEVPELEYGKARVLESGKKVLVLSFGNMRDIAIEVSEKLKKEKVNPTVLDMRFAKPWDKEQVKQLLKDHSVVVTLEDGVIEGGVGRKVQAFVVSEKAGTKVLTVGVPDQFVPHGDVPDLYKAMGMDSDSVLEKIHNIMKK